MTKPPAFQFYAKEWLSSTAEMSLAAQGAYMRLLAWSWDNGPLATDEARRARLVGLTVPKFKRLWSEFSLKWDHTPAGFTNKKLEAKRAELHAYRNRRREAGKAGADSRWQSHDSADGNRIDLPMPSPMRSDGSTSSSSSIEDQDQNPPAVLTFPTDGSKTTYLLTEQQVSDWRALYPGLDVLGECRRALAWVHANPTKRKTAAGMSKFLVGWFNRSLEKPAAAPPNRPRRLGPNDPGYYDRIGEAS